MEGTWKLEVATPFGKHPATLVLMMENGNQLTGHLDSRLGSVALQEINHTGNSFDARVALDFNGKTYEAKMEGTVTGDQLDGTIKVALAIAPTIRYTGTRGEEGQSSLKLS